MSAGTAFVLVGFLVMAAVWVPLITRSPRVPLTLPGFCVVFGVVVAYALGAGPLAASYTTLARHLTAIALLVGVAGTGFKIDRPFRWRSWASAWRLLIGVLPLSIAGVALCAVWLLGLHLGEAILLGAILAPTDPVLASSVQVGPPGTGEEGEVRFALTAEAGLNDGLAFPFVLLGLALLPSTPDRSIARWLGVELVYQVAVGAAIGIAFAFALMRGNRLLPARFRANRSGEGMFAIGIAFIVYGLADLAGTNGFIAVFAAAATIRNIGSDIDYVRKLDESGEQFERLAMVLILALFGGAIAGGLLSALHPVDLALVALALFVVRPLAALLAFLGSPVPWGVRLATGALGVRGLASLYYVSYAAAHVSFADVHRVWSIVALTVLTSIALYGVASEPIMSYLDRLRSPPA